MSAADSVDGFGDADRLAAGLTVGIDPMGWER